MVTTATWASPFSSASVSSLQVADAPRAQGEGRSDREGVRDIGRNARSETIVRERPP